MNDRIWFLSNLLRSRGERGGEALLDLCLRCLKLKKEGITPDVNPDDLYYKMVTTVRSDYPLNIDQRILYEVFNVTYDMGVKDYFELLASCEKEMEIQSASAQLADIMFASIKSGDYKVFIPECENFGYSLFELMLKNPDVRFYTSVRNNRTREFMEILYENTGLTFLEGSIYEYGFTDMRFDSIICIPAFGIKNANYRGDFISRDYALIAAENLMYHLTPEGRLTIVLPAKVTFGGADVEHFREFINNTYQIKEISSLPNKTFNLMSINTYLFVFCNGRTEDILIRKYQMDSDNNLIVKDEDQKLLFADEFMELKDWSIENVFLNEDDEIAQYNRSYEKKDLLNDVATVFRGKAITSKSEGGNIGVINISDITEMGINYDALDSFEEEPRKVAKYILEEGDVLVTSRGTLVKVAVFHENGKPCVASSNINVIRTNKKILIGEYLKLFLESSVGNKIIKALQRGTTIVNINYQDLGTIEVPVPTMQKQCELVEKYNEGLRIYKELLTTAEIAWEKVKSDIQNDLF